MIAPVVDTTWLHRHRDDVIVVDVRWYLDGRSGRVAYESGHLPGAVFVDLNHWLASEPSPAEGRHPLPDPEVFAEGMSQSGITDDDTVVAYDDAGGVIASRLVWMLRVTGHNAALLDGGINPRTSGLERGAVTRRSVTFTTRAWPPERIATIDDAIDRANVVIDARAGSRYRGEFDPVDPRSGHIPGARSIPCQENLSSEGTFLPVEVIQRRFIDAGVVDGERAISYCGSGVTACHNLLALERCGLGRGRLYVGSWSQYSHRADLPIATGDTPR